MILKMGNSSDQNDANFGCAFNNVDFCDRILRLEIASSENDLDDSECDTGFIIQNLHVNSLLLAVKSPFFYKLFNNGMRESQNKANEVTLRINASEEAALMDVLNCVYEATSAPELLDVLMVADKFEVVSCVRHCIELLLKLPMSLEFALSYLELSSSVFVGEVFEPLLDMAKQRISDFSESRQKEALDLPLSALEVVLGSDGLRVNSEDDVFDFILNWARVNYPKLEERREILTKHLTPYICFQYMSGSKLKEVVDCLDFDYEQVSKLMINALISKDQVLSRRVYKYRLVKVVSFECAQPRCAVYFDLKKEECADLFPSKRLYSQPFNVGGHFLNLWVECTHLPTSYHFFGLYVKTTDDSETCIIDCELSVMTKSTKTFLSKDALYDCILTKGKGRGFSDLFGILWTDFMSDDSDYFINEILHLRAQITINNFGAF